MKQVTIGSGISWTICKSFAPHSRQDSHAVTSSLLFYRLDALPGAQLTVSEHQRTIKQYYQNWLFG